MNEKPFDDYDDMALPEGMTCERCFHFKRCTMLFQCKPSNTSCDWAPSRFVPEQSVSKNKAYGECGNVGKTCRNCSAEHCTTRVYEQHPAGKPLEPLPQDVAKLYGIAVRYKGQTLDPAHVEIFGYSPLKRCLQCPAMIKVLKEGGCLDQSSQ